MTSPPSPLRLLLSRQALQAWHSHIEQVLGARPHELVILEEAVQQCRDDIDVAFISRDITGLSTKHELVPETRHCYDLMRRSRGFRWVHIHSAGADRPIYVELRERGVVVTTSSGANAEVVAPHAGIVVEGDLKKNLGAPLRKGDLLLKLAQVDHTYLELQIDQVDVHEVDVGTRGEFALVGRPDQRFPLVMTRLDPASTLRDGRNVFLARAQLEQDSPSWWRPGMGGTARLEVGERPLIWVLTHRTVRTLREWFWL